MSGGKYARSIRLHCPTCGSDRLQHDEAVDNGPVKCASCERISTREELIRENGETIESAKSEMASEVVADLKKTLRDSMRKKFSGSKYIKIK